MTPQVLGLRVLRHEEFESGCEATCNGPYGNPNPNPNLNPNPNPNPNPNLTFTLTLTLP